MAEKSKHILLTGLPGIGKTTLIKKISAELVKRNVGVAGFYTEEIRDESNQRIGFDIVSLDGTKDKLARNINYVKPSEITKCKLGQYIVFPINCERVAIPLFQQAISGILVLDEIGKMELFSKLFESEVRKAFKNPNVLILATIPVPKSQPLPTVEALRSNPGCNVITVDKANRNILFEEVIQRLYP